MQGQKQGNNKLVHKALANAGAFCLSNELHINSKGSNMMYVVEYCPNDLFSPGATFTCTSFDYTLEMGSWPEGIIFTGRGRRIIIQDGQAVELKRVSNDQGTHWQNDITQ